jgi:LemA protein
MIPLLIALAVIVVVLLIAISVIVGMYNSLIQLRNQLDNAWAQIDVQLKRRHDLIPNLVETVKGYAAHEKGTLENVIKARNMAMGATSINDKMQAENALSGTLKTLFAVSENYPDLKANQNFLKLQEEVTSTENKIAFSRQFYNDAVMGYNTKIQLFPTNILAGMFNFVKREFFEVKDEAERAVPQIKF